MTTSGTCLLRYLKVPQGEASNLPGSTHSGFILLESVSIGPIRHSANMYVCAAPVFSVYSECHEDYNNTGLCVLKQVFLGLFP